jgi:hypothetical protein
VPRERWFWAQARQRRGPCTLAELLERVLAQPDPVGILVWRKGLAGWTRAGDLPELQGRLRPASATDPRRPIAPAAPHPAASVPRVAPAGSNLAVYGGLAAAAALLALAAWLFWPRAPVAPHVPTAVPLGATSAENAPAVVIPPGASPAPAPSVASKPSAAAPALAAPGRSGRPSPASVAVEETALPAAALRKLRGVAAWSGERLRITVYNGTAWRVTEIEVRLSRFDGQDLVEDRRPLRLLPPGPRVDEGVADLLSKVAPDRRKPGVNALDTGPFEADVGAKPENFRWEIEAARGYAPR